MRPTYLLQYNYRANDITVIRPTSRLVMYSGVGVLCTSIQVSRVGYCFIWSLFIVGYIYISRSIASSIPININNHLPAEEHIQIPPT